MGSNDHRRSTGVLCSLAIVQLAKSDPSPDPMGSTCDLSARSLIQRNVEFKGVPSFATWRASRSCCFQNRPARQMKRDEVVADQSFKIVVGSIQDHVFSKASQRVLFRIILYRGVVVAFLQGRTLQLKVCLHMKVAQLPLGTDMYSMFLPVFNVFQCAFFSPMHFHV